MAVAAGFGNTSVIFAAMSLKGGVVPLQCGNFNFIIFSITIMIMVHGVSCKTGLNVCVNACATRAQLMYQWHICNALQCC